MHYPFVAFCINKDGELVISHQRDPARKDPLEMEIPLAELDEKGFDGAATAIGTLALRLLSHWYPQQFEAFSALTPAASQAPKG